MARCRKASDKEKVTKTKTHPSKERVEQALSMPMMVSVSCAERPRIVPVSGFPGPWIESWNHTQVMGKGTGGRDLAYVGRGPALV